MRDFIRTIISIGWLLSTLGVSQAQGWRGIVPLHSSRADVEKKIGPPMEANGRTYDLKNERVNVIYSVGNCENSTVEWNVPADTVIAISIYPQTKLLVSDLRTDLDRFEKFINSHNPDSVSYNSIEEGIGVETRSNGEVVVIEYFPASSDRKLRCPKFSPDQLRKNELSYFLFDEYPTLSFADEKKRLDNFAARLLQEPRMTGYIIVHPGSGMRPRDIQARAKRAKHYLVKAHRIGSVRIVTLNGERRGKFGVELYAVPGVLSSPNLDPSRNK